MLRVLQSKQSLKVLSQFFLADIGEVNHDNLPPFASYLCYLSPLLPRFLSDPADQFLIGGLAEDPIELRAVIVDQADPLNDEVVDLPCASHAMKPVLHLDLLSFVRHYLPVYLGIGLVYFLTGISELLIIVGFDVPHVGLLQKIAEEFHKLRLFFWSPAAPLGP